MTDIPLNQLVPSDSKYLAKEDVGQAGMNLTIKGFKQGVEVGTGSDTDFRTIMGFEDMDPKTGKPVKPMVLNRTNLALLQRCFPEATSTGDLKGKTINVFNDPSVDFGGKLVGGIRIRSAQDQTKTSQAQTSTDLDDDIPF